MGDKSAVSRKKTNVVGLSCLQRMLVFCRLISHREKVWSSNSTVKLEVLWQLAVSLAVIKYKLGEPKA